MPEAGAARAICSRLSICEGVLMLPPEIAEGLKLIGEKLDEAVTDRNDQRGATEKAAKAAAMVRAYIKADDMRTTVVTLVCEPLTFDGEWWNRFGELDREKFLETAYFIRKGLSGLGEALVTAATT